MLFSCEESNQNNLVRTQSIEEPDDTELPSNSFSDHFVDSDIKYQYVDETETHDYSGNWDFDNDGTEDSIQFVGNGGAHLYFSLVVKLSSDSENQKFEWLSTDFPLLQAVDSLEKYEESEFSLVNFVVSDFNGDQIDDIFIRLDRTSSVPEKFNHLDAENRKFIISFDQKLNELIVNGYQENWK